MSQLSPGKCRTGIFVCLMLAWGGGLLTSAYAQSLPPEVVAYADMIFHNGKVLTADEKFSTAQAVAIRDGKFLAVGTNQRILAMAGPKTRKVDLQGRSLIPGMIATHQHGYVGNTSKQGVGRVAFKDVASGLEELKAIVAKFPAGQELFIGGPSNKPMTVDVTMAQLDAAAPNNPIAITCQNNQVIVNSLMLKKVPAELSGIMKDAQGRPTGQLRVGAAGMVLYEIMPWHDDFEKSVAQERENVKRWGPKGITTVMGRGQGQAISIVRELWKNKELPVRIRFAHEFLRQNDRPEIFLKRFGNLTDFGDDWLKIIGATTQAVDGEALTENPRIKMNDLTPYAATGQNKWAEGGTMEVSKNNVILANRYGWSLMAYHSNGDLANTILLDTFAEANKERPLAGRHFGMDHQEQLRPKHFAAMKAMGINPAFLDGTFSGDNSGRVEEFGADAVFRMSPVKSSITAGLKPSIEVGDGLEAMKNFILRQTKDGRVWNEAERVSREEALWMYTNWAARYSGEEAILGSIEPGKLGDVVVLAGDYMAWPAEDLGSLGVLMTVVGGKVVFEAPGSF